MRTAEVAPEEVTFEQVAERVKTWTAEEQRRLRGLLEGWLVASEREWTPEQDEQLSHRLKASGVVVHGPTKAPDLEQFRAYVPVAVQGRPVSETLLEERR